MSSHPPSHRRIYLVRHGEVSYFEAGGKPVRPDTVPLTPEGWRQAEALARELADVPLDRALASDLARSVETAAVLTAGRGVAVEPRVELREVQPGRLRDIPVTDLERVFVGAFTAGVGPQTQFLGGETFGSLSGRVLPVFQALLSEPGWRHLLLVAHGGVNRVILTHVLGCGLGGFAALEQDPCCLNVIDVDPAGRCLLRLVNHTPYDPTKAGLYGTTMERLYQEYRSRAGLGPR